MADLDELVQRTIDGDSRAWPALQQAVQPLILAIARRHRGMRSKGLAALPDDLAEVVTATLERLARDDFQNLRRFSAIPAGQGTAAQGTPARGSFDAWLYGAVDFVVREHLRKRFGRAPKPSGEPSTRPAPSKRDLHSQAGRLDDAELDRSYLQTVGMTTKLTVAEIFQHIELGFAADEARALRLYYSEDVGFEELAQALGLPDAKAAERMIRRLNARLRYHFAPRADDSDKPDQ